MPNLVIREHWGAYAARTKHNANAADLTVAFALNFFTPGERLTKKEAKLYKAIPMVMSAPDAGSLLAAELSMLVIDILNIAGNGIYSLHQRGWAQAKVNKYMLEVLTTAKAQLPAKIISGGQTGVDIAGIVAAYKLGIDTEVMMPRGFMQRNVDGVDMYFTENVIRNQILTMVGEL